MEIERKWILNRVPTEFRLISHTQIEQFYLSTSPEVRLGHNPASRFPFYLTIKGEGILTREEIQEEVSEDFFNKAKELVGKPSIKKDYYFFNCGGYPLEVSIVDDGAFIYAEIGFETEEQARNYQLPIDDAVEVTDNPEYKMKNYWLRTRN